MKRKMSSNHHNMRRNKNNPVATVIQVIRQEGNIIPEHTGNLLIVMIEDLEIVKD